MIGKILKILTNLKRVMALIGLIKSAYEDKKVTEEEAKQVLDEAVDILVDMGVVKREE